MQRKLATTLLLCVTAGICMSNAWGRGFGGFHGGGGGGGGFGGGGFGGGGFHGGDFGGGGGGFHGGDFGGGGFGGGNFHGGEYGSGGFNPGGFGGERNPAAFGGAGGIDRGGFGGDRFGGQGLGGEAARNGELNPFDRGGQFGGFGGQAPTASRLNSFLGLPTDSGLSAASGHVGDMHEWTGPNGATVYHGSTGERGSINGRNGAAAGERGVSGTVVKGADGGVYAHGEAGERGAAVGPNGAAAGERGASGTVAKGPNGGEVAHGQAGERGAAAGPNGVAGSARGASGTVIKGPNGGTVAHGEAGGRGFYSGAGGAGTWHWSAGDMRVQGNYVRTNYNHWNAFHPNWYAHYPNAWWANGFAAGVWTACTWAAINDWFGSAWAPVAYSYGDDVTYVDNNVCLYGQPLASTADYYQSAADLAQTGELANIPSQPPPQTDQQAAPVDAANAQWLPLGVFEAIPGTEKSSNMTFQLAVNKDGIIRGNYYNTGDNNVQQVQGAVDKKTQRATWVVADKKTVIFDTGLYNLTKDESTMLVHEGPDKTQQWSLVRLKQPAGGAESK